MTPETPLENSMARKCSVTRSSLLKILIKTAEVIVETEMTEEIEEIDEKEIAMETEAVIETEEATEIEEVIEEEIEQIEEETEVETEQVETEMETEQVENEEETEETEEEMETEIEETETVKTDLRDAIVTTEEEGHHHQANALGVEKQVIGKNIHLRRESGEVWLIVIGHDMIWYPL